MLRNDKRLGVRLAALLAVCASAPVLAQTLPPGPAAAGQPAPHPLAPGAKAADGKPKPPQNPAQVREKLRQSIRQMRAQKLAEVLKPDPQTAGKLQEISEKYGDQVMLLHEQAGTARRDLVKQLQAPTPDQAAVTRLTEEMLTLRGRINRLEEERMVAVRKVLTPVQFARYMIAWPKINRQIQEKIYQALQKMGDRRDTGDVF